MNTWQVPDDPIGLRSAAAVRGSAHSVSLGRATVREEHPRQRHDGVKVRAEIQGLESVQCGAGTPPRRDGGDHPALEGVFGRSHPRGRVDQSVQSRRLNMVGCALVLRAPGPTCAQGRAAQPIRCGHPLPPKRAHRSTRPDNVPQWRVRTLRQRDRWGLDAGAATVHHRRRRQHRPTGS